LVRVIGRFSSRTQPLTGMLPELLRGAVGYDRIAGYFSSSILDIAGESLDAMAGDQPIRIICNSDLSEADVLTARAAQQAMVREWKMSLPEDITPHLRKRLERLYDLLTSGRLQVRVLPDDRFGLLHGKAGVIARADGSAIAFVGSANETISAWKHNYEIVWTDGSADGIAWVRQEFEALWRDPKAFNLADGVIQDIARVARRTVVVAPDLWKAADAGDAQAAIELPIYRRENGLWAHQKWFINHAFTLHKGTGARLVLADQVGLGKTLQLALAAKLMMLWAEATCWRWCPNRSCTSGRMNCGTCCSCQARSGPARRGRTSTGSSTPATATRSRVSVGARAGSGLFRLVWSSNRRTCGTHSRRCRGNA